MKKETNFKEIKAPRGGIKALVEEFQTNRNTVSEALRFLRSNEMHDKIRAAALAKGWPVIEY